MSETTPQPQIQKPAPSQVPFNDPNYTYADRERELAFMDHLLQKHIHDNRMELAFVRQQILSGEYLTASAGHYQQQQQQQTVSVSEPNQNPNPNPSEPGN
jgi:hypothetical protein